MEFVGPWTVHMCTVHYRKSTIAVTVYWTVVANIDFSTMNSASMHCSRIHKFYFLATFSLKIGLTILFAHLKIILLQYFQFSVFNFSKINSIQTEPKSYTFCFLNKFVQLGCWGSALLRVEWAERADVSCFEAWIISFS